MNREESLGVHLAGVERNAGEVSDAPPVWIADPETHLKYQIGMVPTACFVNRHFFPTTEMVMNPQTSIFGRGNVKAIIHQR